MVDGFHQTGSVELKTSLKSVTGIVACTAPFVGIAAYGIAVGGAAAAAKTVVPVMALPVLGAVAWIVRLLPVRVVVDHTGVLIRDERVEWAEITEIRIGVARSRATYYCCSGLRQRHCGTLSTSCSQSKAFAGRPRLPRRRHLTPASHHDAPG